MQNFTPQDFGIMARTIYGEARGEYYRKDGGMAALIAVGNVIMNRLFAKTWFGASLQEVCLKPFQFSCWNKQDPNHPLLTSKALEEDPLYGLCKTVATQVASSQWPDLTKGSDHYYATTLSTPPVWNLKTQPRLKLGQHLFYRLTSDASGKEL